MARRTTNMFGGRVDCRAICACSQLSATQARSPLGRARNPAQPDLTCLLPARYRVAHPRSMEDSQLLTGPCSRSGAGFACCMRRPALLHRAFHAPEQRAPPPPSGHQVTRADSRAFGPAWLAATTTRHEHILPLLSRARHRLCPGGATTRCGWRRNRMYAPLTPTL